MENGLQSRTEWDRRNGSTLVHFHRPEQSSEKVLYPVSNLRVIFKSFAMEYHCFGSIEYLGIFH